MPSFFRKEDWNMQLYVLRHGTTLWNLEHKIQGATDIPLHEIGREEALLIREKVRDLPIQAIYTSPLKRALETAQLIHPDPTIPCIVDRALQEVSFGDWEGKTWDEVQGEYPTLLKQIPSSGYIDPPGGESFQQAAQRICPFVDSLREKGENCLLVTHKAVVRFLFYCLTKKTPAQTGVIDIPNLSILQFHIREEEEIIWSFL